MTKPDDAAFPTSMLPPGGLTKREWFAGLAMQGLLADANYDGNMIECVRLSLQYTDALIAELNKE